MWISVRISVFSIVLCSAALLKLHIAVALSNVPWFTCTSLLGLERVLSMSRLISLLAQEEARILYTGQHRYVHWANSIWHVAARAHCNASPPCIPEHFPKSSILASIRKKYFWRLLLNIESSGEIKIGNRNPFKKTTWYEITIRCHVYCLIFWWFGISYWESLRLWTGHTDISSLKDEYQFPDIWPLVLCIADSVK